MPGFDPFSPFPTLRHHARHYRERTAIISPDVRITYSDLPVRVEGIADWLLDRGFNPNTMTAVTVPQEVSHLLILAALVCLGTPNISIGSFESPGSRRRLIDLLDVEQAIGLQNPPPGAAQDCLPNFYPPADAVPTGSARGRMMAVTLGEEDKVIFRSTSGTTGVPKTFGMTTALMMELISSLQADAGKACVLRTSSLEHDASRIHCVSALFAGQTAPLLHPVTAETLAPFCARAGVSEIHGGTYRLASLLASPPDPSHRLPEGVRFLTGASRVPGPLRAAAMERLTPELYVSFATSEVGVVSVAQPDEHRIWPEGVGFPNPGIEVELRDEDGKPVSRGEVGALWVKKYGVPGDGSAAAPGWVTTGDLLSWPEGGPLIFHARTDDMMVLNGINIFPGPIEDALSTHCAVAEVVAYPVSSAIHGQIPVAAVVLKPGAIVGDSELMHHTREKLGIRAPRQVVIVDRIPRTETGKPRTRDLSRQARVPG